LFEICGFVGRKEQKTLLLLNLPKDSTNTPPMPETVCLSISDVLQSPVTELKLADLWKIQFLETL